MSDNEPSRNGGTDEVQDLWTSSDTTTTYKGDEVVVCLDYFIIPSLAATHLNMRSKGLGPHGIFSELRIIADFIQVLRGSESFRVLYVTHRLGVAWKGRIYRHLSKNKSSVYLAVDELHSIGILETVEPNHPELQAAIKIERGKNPTTNNIKGHAYTIAEQYIDPLSNIFRHNQDIISPTVEKAVEKTLRELAAVKAQAAQMTLAIEGKCSVNYCTRQAAISGYCAAHYQVMRTNR